jgi:hypothetical protein
MRSFTYSNGRTKYLTMCGVSDQDHPTCMPILEFINFVTGPNLGLKIICLCSRNDLRHWESPVAVTALDLRQFLCKNLLVSNEGSSIPHLTSVPWGVAIRVWLSRELRVLTTLHFREVTIQQSLQNLTYHPTRSAFESYSVMPKKPLRPWTMTTGLS